MGDDIRWVGNEGGLGRETEWSCTAIESDAMTDKRNKELGITFMSKDLGSRSLLEKATQLNWFPSEVDVSIRPGWFYHKEEGRKYGLPNQAMYVPIH